MKNINGIEMIVTSVHLRTDKIKALNHNFRKPVTLDRARAIVRRLVKGQKVYNCMLENGNSFWPL